MRRFYGRDSYSQRIGIFVDIFSAEIVPAKNVVDDINVAELFISDMVITQIYTRCGICAQNSACRINIYFQISYNNARRVKEVYNRFVFQGFVPVRYNGSFVTVAVGRKSYGILFCRVKI